MEELGSEESFLCLYIWGEMNDGEIDVRTPYLYTPSPLTLCSLRKLRCRTASDTKNWYQIIRASAIASISQPKR